MSYIPSERIGSALASATVGVWLERIAKGRTALVCKIPETAIKAVLQGATTSLLIGEVQTSLLRLLCLGLVVQDEVDKPLAIQKPTTDRDDIDLLAEVLASGSTTLHFVNELNHPALSAWCQLERTAAATAAGGLATCDPWVLTPDSSHVLPPPTFTSTLTSALDLYQQHIFTSPDDTTSRAVTFSARIPLTLTLWRPPATIAVTATRESEPFAIDDRDEGRKLERLGRVVVDALYPLHSYHSPRVQDGATRRELVDLLGFSADWICLIEAKAMSMLDSSSFRSSDRRKANIERGITKGLGQLGGALKNIRSGAALFRADGNPLTLVNPEAPAHAIVLLSEMYSFVDWRAVANAVASASDNEVHRALFHVFDLQELVSLARGCVDSAAFNQRLIQRWLLVKDRGTAYGRIRHRP
jgi:hypothetical protein